MILAVTDAILMELTAYTAFIVPMTNRLHTVLESACAVDEKSSKFHMVTVILTIW